MVNSRGRWLTIRAEPTIRSDARLAQIVHYAVADELRNAEYWWRATPDAEGASLATPANVSLLTEVSSPRSALTLV
ncbi:MAG: hypothetical protein QOH31_7032 [Verrucomicrobiota bacterium]|jgi:hypothetical protein